MRLETQILCGIADLDILQAECRFLMEDNASLGERSQKACRS